VGRPTTAGFNAPERLAQVTYLATICEREGDTLPLDLDPPDPIQRKYLIDSSGTHPSKGDSIVQPTVFRHPPILLDDFYPNRKRFIITEMCHVMTRALYR
jgi:hypothetical protein